jgi:hypothetical protein
VLLGAGSWHLGFTVADPDRPGQWQGLFSSGLPLARAVGPIVLSTLVLTWTGPGWVVLAAVFGGAGLALRPVASWAERRQPIRNPDEIAALICLIVTINAWNAIGVSTRTWQPGTYQPD